MNAASDDLDALRREIDALDDGMHDLLMRRTEVVERIAAVKQRDGSDAVFMRPGREAVIVRRLMGRHKGLLPRTVIARIWRELISAYCRLEGPFAVAVLAPAKSVAYWDMARRHYGSSTPMSLHRNAHQVLSAVAEKPGTIGVLPVPQDGEGDPWWPNLASGATTAVRVVMRLPFLPDDAGEFENVTGLVVAAAEPEPSGEDRSLLAVSGQDQISRARLNELLKKAGLPGRSMTSLGGKDTGGGELHLVEIDDFVGRGDPRLAKLIELGKRTVQQAVPLGAYAVPLPPA
jgi:chorismate mutase-like protein